MRISGKFMAKNSFQLRLPSIQISNLITLRVCMKHNDLVRAPVVAGRFYEGEAKALCNYVQTSFAKAQENMASQEEISPASLVFLPHAGHFFCGHVMAETLARVQLPKTIILLGPNHTGKGEELSVWPQGYWQTPLGNIPIDAKLAQEILQTKAGFAPDVKAHLHEHSLEVILPFLQLKIPQLHIVPIAIGGRDFNMLKNAGNALGYILNTYEDKEIAIVLSSDLHHFADHQTTMAVDELALEAFMAFDPLKLAQVVGQNNISMCGICPAIVALYALEKIGNTSTFQLVNHTTSFEMSGDASKVVGYAGLFVNKSTCQGQHKHV